MKDKFSYISNNINRINKSDLIDILKKINRDSLSSIMVRNEDSIELDLNILTEEEINFLFNSIKNEYC